MSPKRKKTNGKKANGKSCGLVSCASLSTEYLKAHRKRDGTLYYTVKGIRGRTFTGRTAARHAMRVYLGKKNGLGNGSKRRR